MKRRIERILALLLTTIILAVTAEAAETILPANPDNCSGNREPNMRVRAESFPNDPYWSLQWGPKKIEADWAWNATLGNSSILVAVIDTGIDYTHPDLAANYVELGYDWVNNDADPMDDNNHGTRVAGVIAAQINNGIGIAGLAQVKIMAEKVLDEHGEGYVDQLANGIYHATDTGAKIISMSLSTEYNGSLLYDAVKYAYEKNVLLVAAAGNEAPPTDNPVYPAAYDEVIAVSSTDENDQKAYSSKYGDWIELAAPGVNIYSTIRGGGYGYWSGTSFACPHVSGLAALLWSEFPNVTRDWVRARLRETADDLGDPGFDIFYGYGRINARKAIYGISPAINYTLTIATTIGGTTNPLPGNYTCTEGQSVPVQAIPDTGYGFDHWELDETNVGSANPYSVLMTDNHTLYAVFVQINYTLTITATAGGTTSPAPEIYIYPAGSIISVTALPDINYVLDYWELDGLNAGPTNPLSLTIEANHTLKAVFRLSVSDIAVTKIILSKTIVGQSYSINIEVAIANQGDYPETFNVTLHVGHWNETRTIYLPNEISTILTFLWNTTGFAKGNYTVSAYAWPVPGETDITDNSLTDGTVYVGIPGDVNGDKKVDLKDVYAVAKAYGSFPGHPKWNPVCDINNDNKVDLKDYYIVCKNYGKVDP
jgi:hypothetical protein